MKFGFKFSNKIYRNTYLKRSQMTMSERVSPLTLEIKSIRQLPSMTEK